MRETIINGVKFTQDDLHTIFKETRIIGNDGRRQEIFFVPDEYLQDEAGFARECNRLYRNFYK